MKKHCGPWMLIVCLLAIGLIALPPLFGVSAAGVGTLGLLLMVACCVLPMVLLLVGQREGACDKTEKADAQNAGKKSAGCH